MARFNQTWGGRWTDDNGNEYDSFGLTFDGQFSVTASNASLDVCDIPAAELKRMVKACIEHLKLCGEWEDG